MIGKCSRWIAAKAIIALFLGVCALNQAEAAQPAPGHVAPLTGNEQFRLQYPCTIFSTCYTTTNDLSLEISGAINCKSAIPACVGNGVADDTAAINACITAAYNAKIQTCYLPATGNCYLTSGPIYLADPSFAANISNPITSAFSLALIGDQGGANGDNFGTQLCPNFNNNVALWVGPGRGMHVKGIQIIGPNNGYRAQQNSAGCGICIASGGANGDGASRTVIEDSEVDNFYSCFGVGTNGSELGDSNTWRKDHCVNAYNCYIVASFNNDINDVVEPTCEATVAYNSLYSRNILIVGGNPSASAGVSNAFTISSVSAVTATQSGCPNSNYCYSFTAVLSTPDSYVNTVYNSYMLLTAHFGVVPVTMTNWNAGTSTGTFQILPNWGAFYFQQNINAITTSDLQNELQAVTTLYAAERVTVLLGNAFQMLSPHIENPGACTTFIDSTSSFGGDSGIKIDRAFFNYDPGLSGYSPPNSPSPAHLALFYCQESFPFINVEGPTGARGSIEISDSLLGQGLGSDPVVIDWATSDTNAHLYMRGLGQSIFNPVIRTTGVYQSTDSGYVSGGGVALYTAGLGAGEWTQKPFYATNSSAGAGRFQNGWAQGMGQVPYVGFRPAPWAQPRILASMYTTLGSITSANSLGSYPIPNGSSIYTVLDPLGAPAGKFVQSAHSFDSYGQNLTTSNISSLSLAWKGQSFSVLSDATTCTWLYPGLQVKLNNGSGYLLYEVTGVYPHLTLDAGTHPCTFTVLNAQQDGTPALLTGTKTTIYTASQINQDSYSWKTLTLQ